MLYSIIPPILLVLSVIGIIIFFVKKAPEAEKLGLELERGGASGPIGTVSGPIGISRQGNRKAGAVRQLFLAILEGIIGLIRGFFQKSEKAFAGLTGKIRDKRGVRSEKKSGETRSEEEMLERIGRYEAKKDSVREEKPAVGGDREVKKENFEEKAVKPMVSDKVVIPNSGMRKKKEQEIKDRLEELLIERIAMNPRDTEAYERLGEYYFEVGNYEHAKDCFKQVIKLDPINRSVKYKMKKLETLLSR